MRYNPELIRSLKDDLVNLGIKELSSSDTVDRVMKQNGTKLVIVNSVCSCSANIAHPAIRNIMEDDSIKKPDRVVSVFAGVDIDAIKRFRIYIADIPPSSPCIALFRNQELLHFIPKDRIETWGLEGTTKNLKLAFEHFHIDSDDSDDTE
ncbi:BrxA/BrxB family bacilliredoxin [Chitinophaga silvatica]|uniref:BrxA/BrxB family bacilliredoxin n=1 Tax=Chitinophaga silvatica TaxID=2282649 RepID=A0A3E1Y2Y2_9BACT|nr:BrxA/BrxB family bacilliredoxin [Chitinophaga silvatica]RFS19070.1 BrxA/BrxB family bacilliredoxin [Chitinophaga silvatica]